KPDLSYLPTFNVTGGRPDERFGTQGSFTRGVRIMSGGPSRDVPVDTETANHGTVLFVSTVFKPDCSGEARINAAGGRPTERLGSSRFTPGAKTFLGGAPRDVPVDAVTANHGKVLFVSSVHKPDCSGEAHTNGTRPDERFGTHGRFTPGARRWAGGKPRDVPLAVRRDPGTVIFQSSSERSKPALSFSGETNVAGGREDERHGRLGSFEHGVVEFTGGPLHMPSNSAYETALWHEGGQKENRYRRCAPSHFVAGVSILSGGMPVY
ncbi:unnamed protein product, partial [Pylaiella littoralis]